MNPAAKVELGGMVEARVLGAYDTLGEIVHKDSSKRPFSPKERMEYVKHARKLLKQVLGELAE